MKESEYKELLEKKYGKALKDIMHELIVDRYMDQWVGAEELGIPTKLFVKWRTRFRLGPMQRIADHAEKRRAETIEKYESELQFTEFNRGFIFKDEYSLRGFREVVERMLELAKGKRASLDIDSFSDMAVLIQIGTLENTINLLDHYEKKELHEQYELELKDFGGF